MRPGEWVAVHGCGGVGLSAVQIAAAMGANVIAVDVSEEKLAAARGEGALHTINAAKDEPIGAIMGLTGGGAHVSIDALGVKATCLNSVMCTRKRGRHLQVGLTSGAEQGQIALPIDIIVLKEVRIIGSLGMQAPNFGRMLHMVENRQARPGEARPPEDQARGGERRARVDGQVRHGRGDGHQPVLEIPAARVAVSDTTPKEACCLLYRRASRPAR